MTFIATSNDRQRLYQGSAFETFCERHGIPTGRTIPDIVIKLAQDAYRVDRYSYALPHHCSLEEMRADRLRLDGERDALLEQAMDELVRAKGRAA